MVSVGRPAGLASARGEGVGKAVGALQLGEGLRPGVGALPATRGGQIYPRRSRASHLAEFGGAVGKASRRTFLLPGNKMPLGVIPPRSADPVGSMTPACRAHEPLSIGPSACAFSTLRCRRRRPGLPHVVNDGQKDFGKSPAVTSLSSWSGASSSSRAGAFATATAKATVPGPTGEARACRLAALCGPGGRPHSRGRRPTQPVPGPPSPGMATGAVPSS
jgi:hypothetical protein